MEWKKTAALIGLRVSPQQSRAMSYLENAGQRFCAHFGYQNAIEKARDHWRNRSKAKRK